MIRKIKYATVTTFCYCFLLLQSSALVSMAQLPGKNLSKHAATVTYLGTRQEMLLFSVNYHNANQGKFTVEISHNSENILFRESYTDKMFDKKFLLPLETEGKLYFVITNLKNNTTEKFEVSTESRLLEDVNIK